MSEIPAKHDPNVGFRVASRTWCVLRCRGPGPIWTKSWHWTWPRARVGHNWLSGSRHRFFYTRANFSYRIGTPGCPIKWLFYQGSPTISAALFALFWWAPFLSENNGCQCQFYIFFGCLNLVTMDCNSIEGSNSIGICRCCSSCQFCSVSRLQTPTELEPPFSTSCGAL